MSLPVSQWIRSKKQVCQSGLYTRLPMDSFEKTGLPIWAVYPLIQWIHLFAVKPYPCWHDEKQTW